VCPLVYWQLVILKYPSKVKLAYALLIVVVYSSFITLILVVNSLI